MKPNPVQPLLDALNQVIVGKPLVTKLALCCVLARGHLLLEDLPGMGKTTLAKAMADLFGVNISRVQMTNDLLPSDVLGFSTFDNSTAQWQFHAGPIFQPFFMADELNRASPKTQSALLEAMAEQQVSIEGKTYDLPSPFFVIATQNSSEDVGTFPLPESQLDRFLMRLTLGYLNASQEKQVLLSKGEAIQKITPLASLHQLQAWQKAVDDIAIADQVYEQVFQLVQQTRTSHEYQGLSTRATIGLVQAMKAYAFIEGRSFASIQDLHAVMPAVSVHRLTLKKVAQHNGEQWLMSILAQHSVLDF